jgi:hypothetical protein
MFYFNFIVVLRRTGHEIAGFQSFEDAKEFVAGRGRTTDVIRMYYAHKKSYEVVQMEVYLVTQVNENVRTYEIRKVDYDYDGNPYGDAVHFAVGSNQTIELITPENSVRELLASEALLDITVELDIGSISLEKALDYYNEHITMREAKLCLRK